MEGFMAKRGSLITLIFVFYFTNPALAVQGVDCGIKPEEWAECIFMTEDKQLTMDEQSTLRKTEYDIERNINDARQAATQWSASLKSKGPTAYQIEVVPQLIRSLTISSASALTVAYSRYSSDPWNLHKIKKIDYQAQCIFYYGEPCLLERDVVDLVKLGVGGISDAKNIIGSLLKNPRLTLGEEWGDFERDINHIRAAYKSARSTSHSLAPNEIEKRLKEKFKSYGQQLTRQDYNRGDWEYEAKEASIIMNDTIRDAHIATQKQFNRMAISRGGDKSDLESLKVLNDKTPFQVGRMQAMEQMNMRELQSLNAWRSIQESYLTQNDLFSLDMAEEYRQQDTKTAYEVNYFEDKNKTIRNNGKGYGG